MLRAKKSLGQNFLNSPAVAREIVRAGELTSIDTVVEIGPGKGFLTREILTTGARVIAIEKDDRMIPLLEETFAREMGAQQLILIHGDIVEILENNSLVMPNKYKVIANIPYYITGYLLRAFLEHIHKPSQMILMVQKEVADRIIARDHKESILSLSVKAYGDPKLIKKVPARYFSPAPKVDSAVLAINNISNKNLPDTNFEKRFFEILKAGFAHKRKVLRGNLRGVIGNTLLEKNIPERTRAEDLVLKDWLNLAQL